MSRVRVGVAGCGSVSGAYLADMQQSPYVEVVSVCDTDAGRARERARGFVVPNHYDSVDAMLEGPPFDLLVNLTAMPSHFEVNMKGLQARRHVLCEKPIATSREEARLLLAAADAQGVDLYGAPIVVTSPAFACMARMVASGDLGRVHAAHGRYGHPGPSWGPWFYRKGGGSLFDLGVYNITFLTGLLGPARSVTALTGTAVAERDIEGEHVQVEADDNVMLLIDHGDSVFSCVQTGFVYGMHHDDWTIEVIGTKGSAYLLGWDWAPAGVEAWDAGSRSWRRSCEDQGEYRWEHGASYVAECMAAGRRPLIAAAHVCHVLDVMLAAHESSAQGRRVPVESHFTWPVPLEA